jgi:phosphoribosylamine--glycine ligase
MSAGGYPGSYQKGLEIIGLDKAGQQPFVEIFHAGTALEKKKIVTAGGRVLGITALGGNLEEAISRAYVTVNLINWPGRYYRKDIGQKALQRRHRTPEPAGKPLVGIVMGSDSDLPVMQEAAALLEEFRIPFEMTIVSAHRTPARLYEYAGSAVDRGLQVVIAGAGGAAHLPGMVAAITPLPVIGVPVKGSNLGGEDSLFSIVQMPPGVPVATVAINGARNAGILAAQILATADPGLRRKLVEFKEALEAMVMEKVAKLAERSGE